MKLKPLKTSARLVKVEVEETDWEAQRPQDLLWMLQQMMLIRAFEEELLEMKGQNLIHGPVHTSIGQEGVAAGMGCALRPADRITGTHRAHHHYLAKVLSAHKSPAYNPLNDGITPRMQEDVRVLMCEIMGLADGCSGGRGGSMHLCNPDAGVVGTNAIVAGGVAHATGVAWADKVQERDSVTVCFFGDGALCQGVLDESSNLAALWKAPVIYFIENNRYAVGTAVDQSCSAKALYQKGVAYGMPGAQINGMNPLAVKLGLEALVGRRDEGWLPCYVEAETYRYLHHAGDLPGSAYGYRHKDEEAEWRKRDPIERCCREMTRMGLLDKDAERTLREQARACVAAAAESCTEPGDGGARRARESLWPRPDTLFVGLRDDRVSEAGPFAEQEDVECLREIIYSDAIAEVTGRWLQKDPYAYVCGEEVANLGGGAYRATKGLAKKFPDRVRNTPISEAGFCGLACGAAMNGMHPIVEIMFPSFALVATDQLFNQIGQLAHIYGGRVSLPLVVRTRVAIGLGYGAQHSLDPVALFSLFPGWRIFVPTTPFDYIGLFNAAMKLKSPTLMVEHHEFYERKGFIPGGPPEHVVRPGKAKVLRQGRQVTVAAYGCMVSRALEAAAELEREDIHAEVIDLRTVDDAGIDYETLGRSLGKTGMLVTAEQAPACNSVGAKIAAQCQKRFFDCFDGPPMAVNAPDVPLPVSRRLELLCIPSKDAVAEQIRKAAKRQV